MSFLEKGEINSEAMLKNDEPALRISTRWFPSQRRDDALGAPFATLSKGKSGWRGAFGCIFQDADRNVWRAELVSDDLLRLDNGRDRPVILRHGDFTSGRIETGK